MIFLSSIFLAVQGTTPAEAGFCSTLDSSQESVDVGMQPEATAVLTRRILLSMINLERFTLTCRLNRIGHPGLRHFRRFLSQQCAAAGEMAIEVNADRQFAKGRFHPERINPRPLRNTTRANVAAMAITAGGSCAEVALDALADRARRRRGLDQRSANRFVRAKIADIDELLAQRDLLVASNYRERGGPGGDAEGRLLRDLRSSIVDEYVQWHAADRGQAIATNAFYLMNAAVATGGAVTSRLESLSVSNPRRWKGPASIMFALSGAALIFPPLLSRAAGSYAQRRDLDLTRKYITGRRLDQLAGPNSPDEKRVASTIRELAIVFPSPIFEQLSVYSQSKRHFIEQLNNANVAMARFDKVGLQSPIIGPAVGGMFFSEGLLDTVGYYKYKSQPRKEIGMFYRGTLTGTTAAGTQMMADSVFLLADFATQSHLERRRQLPAQLIAARLKDLDRMEDIVKIKCIAPL